MAILAPSRAPLPAPATGSPVAVTPAMGGLPNLGGVVMATALSGSADYGGQLAAHDADVMIARVGGEAVGDFKLDNGGLAPSFFARATSACPPVSAL